MKKTIICLLLALCLCLCVVLASCKPDDEPEPPPEEDPSGEVGEKKGNVYYTVDQGGDVDAAEPNEPVEDQTVRY